MISRFGSNTAPLLGDAQVAVDVLEEQFGPIGHRRHRERTGAGQ